MAPQNIEPGSANSSCHGSRIPVRLRMPAKRAAEFIIFHHWGPVWQRKVPPNWLNYHAYGSSRTFLGSGTGVWFRGLAVPSETVFGSIGIDKTHGCVWVHKPCSDKIKAFSSFPVITIAFSRVGPVITGPINTLHIEMKFETEPFSLTHHSWACLKTLYGNQKNGKSHIQKWNTWPLDFYMLSDV